MKLLTAQTVDPGALATGTSLSFYSGTTPYQLPNLRQATQLTVTEFLNLGKGDDNSKSLPGLW